MTGNDEYPQRPLEMYCGICRMPLERVLIDGADEMFFQHSLATMDAYGFTPHTPEPIPHAEFTSVSNVCDFCSSTEVAASVHFAANVIEETEVAGSTFTSDLGQDWTTCSECLACVQGGKLVRLVTRAIDNIVAKNGFSDRAQLYAYLRPIYEQFMGSGFTVTPLNQSDR